MLELAVDFIGGFVCAVFDRGFRLADSDLCFALQLLSGALHFKLFRAGRFADGLLYRTGGLIGVAFDLVRCTSHATLHWFHAAGLTRVHSRMFRVFW